MTDMITAEEAEKLLAEVAQNQPRVCVAWCGKSKEDCLCYKAGVAANALNDAAPDLARAVIDLHADRDRLAAANAALQAQVARLAVALSPVENMHSWTESAADGEAVIMTVGTVRRMRAALAEVQADAQRKGDNA